MTQLALELLPQNIDRRALRDEAKAAIKQRLNEGGVVHWKALRAKFPSVPDRTWWRWVASEKKAKRISCELDSLKRQINANDIATAMVQQMRDIDLLQKHAMTDDGQIKNFALFAQALTLRERQLSSFTKALAPLAQRAELEKFCDTVIDAVAGIDKGVAIQIMTVLRESQQNRESVAH